MKVNFTSVKESFDVSNDTDRFTGIVRPTENGGTAFYNLEWWKKSKGSWEVKSSYFVSFTIFISNKGVASCKFNMSTRIDIEQFKGEVDYFVKACEIVKEQFELEAKQ